MRTDLHRAAELPAPNGAGTRGVSAPPMARSGSRPGGAVPDRVRPSRARAAAAARLAGADDSPAVVASRMRHAARRSRLASGPVDLHDATSAADSAPTRPAPENSRATSTNAGSVRARSRRGPAHFPAALERPLAAVAGGAALAVAAVAPARRTHGQEQARPHLSVVPDPGLSPAQRRRRARALLVTGVAGATLIGLALVYFHVVLAQRQFTVDHLQTQVEQAQSTYQQRRLEVAQEGSPEHIVSMAEGQLGMVAPAQVTYLTPAAGTTVPGASGTSNRSGAASSSATSVPSGSGRPPTATGQAAQPSATAPVGDADWPHIKQLLAGVP